MRTFAIDLLRIHSVYPRACRNYVFAFILYKIQQIMTDNYHDGHPVLQVLGSKKVSGAAGSDRYRLLLSDGQYLQSFAMLATQLNDLVVNGSLSEYTIIRVQQHITSVVNRTPGTEKSGAEK